MKIAHVLYSGLGGTGNVFFSFIKADEQKIYSYEAIFAGVENIREEYVTKSNDNKIQWEYIPKRKRLDLIFNRHFITSIKASNSSVILLHGSRFIVLAKLSIWLSKYKKKIVVCETQANQLKTKTEWIWLILSMLFADRIIFLTDSFKEEIRKKLKFIYFPKKIDVINNGLDLDFFRPQTRFASKPIVLGMQSRIIPIKDHATLLNAFALVQQQYPKLELQLKIAGDGESLQEMQQLARQLKINNEVVFTGMLNENDLVIFLQSLDIYIHASLGETMSTALMQAMACKLPIIASDVPGINNMIENNKTGILVPVKDKIALANAIHLLTTDQAKMAELKEAAFDFATLNYSNKTMFAKYQAIFESLVTE